MVPITEASAKVRSGGPVDDEDELDSLFDDTEAILDEIEQPPTDDLMQPRDTDDDLLPMRGISIGD